MSDNNQSSGRLGRRRFLGVAGAAGIAGLSGCRSLYDDSVGRRSPTGATTGSGQLGSFTIGALDTDFGTDVVRGAQMAVDELNASGAVDGEVKLVSASGSASPNGESKAYRKLLNRGADVTIGGLYPRGYLPPMAKAEKLHLTSVSPWPLPARLISKSVSPVGGDPEAEYEKYKYFFRVGPLNLIDLQKAQAQLVTRYADQLGWERIGIVVESLNIGAERRVDKLKERFSEVVEVPVAEVVSGSISDWTPIFNELERKNVDLAAVFLIISAVVANEQWADQERPFEMGGIHLPAMEQGYWQSVNGDAQALWTMNAATPLTSNTEHTQPFYDTYAQRYGGSPAFVGPLSYDAVKVYAHARAQVGSGSPEKLVPFLEEDCAFTGGTFVPELGFRGPDAEFAHDIDWDSIEDSGVPVFQQWQQGENGGRMEAFAPERNKTADYVQPPWLR